MNPNVPYVGNQDYRGYLNYLGSQGNAQAKQLITGGTSNLGYVNNEGKYTGSGLPITQGLYDANSNLYNQYQQLSSYNPNANLGGGGSYAATAPNWDLNSIYNNAGSGAAAQVNPYYTSQLQKFQNDQAQAKALQQQQHDLNLQNLQTQLTNTLQGNETSRGRTSQDVLTNEQQIGQQADYRQQDQGQQFDEARIAQAKQLAQGGLTGSGLGNQQTLGSETSRNVQEQRQGVEDQQKVAGQELTKARTFEDLANSDVLSKQSEGQGEKQQQIDWDKFVQGQSEGLRSYTDQAEQERLSRLSTVQRQLAQQQVNDMIHNLSNPQQRSAAASAYGNSF